MNHSPILIIGNKGKTGLRVEQRLQKLGYTTRGVSRSSSPSFDWRRSETWPAALEGVTTAYVTYQPDLSMPFAEGEIREFVETAKQTGLQHLVLLSGRGEPGAELAEEIVKQSGISWNVVRASWFFQNFSESFMLDGILAGELVLPVGDVPEPFIDVEDIADVAVAALTQPELLNRLFEVSGPRAISFAQCMAELSKALGREVTFTQVPVDDYIAVLQEQGVPEEMQWLLRELFTNVLDGRNSQPVNGVEEALGRPATDFSVYLQRTVQSGIWEQEQEEEKRAV
jgi:uncharacterized protein YbjT (DUF2867 family)